MDYVNINEYNDIELATRMRSSNYEKYKSLVRMHLSFELELNTDEFDLDLPCHEVIYEDKGKLKKWNRLSKKHRLGHVAASSVTTACAAGAAHSPTECEKQPIDAGFLLHLQELKEFLMLEKNLTQEGLFRKTGAVSRQNELRLHIQHEKSLQLKEAGYSAHDCASVFKSFLAELSEPLLTDAHYPVHLQIAPLCEALVSKTYVTAERQQHLLNSVQLLMLLLPDEHRALLQHIIEMLHAVAQNEGSNKMTAENLATLFTPHLICPRNLPPEVLHFTAKRFSSIIAYMILRGLDIFAVPAKVATDIRAYFLERKRKKTMSPEQTLDESISDTVNTVYTFVDRAATAAATNRNNTDTELAQLYAHIQSLPESSKKRRLIKQFNKQNGQGTPLQLVVMNRLKNNEATRSAKSLGDSIKKHIFHKSIMLRTPKRTTPMPSMGNETPNLLNSKQPKMRVLFQSPTTNACTTTTTTTTSTINSTNLKSTLHKSISSTSLKIESTSSNSDSSAASVYGYSASAPVSRQQSQESSTSTASIAAQQADETDALPLNGNVDKKSVAWHEHQLFEIEEYSNPCTPVQQTSRYKSEPNLCSLLPQQVLSSVHHADDALAPIVEVKSLTRKLMKGVSMGNLRFPFSTPETTKRLVRSVSATLKRRPSEEPKHSFAVGGSNIYQMSSCADVPLLEDVDDDDSDTDIDLEDNDEDGVDKDSTLSEETGSSSELPAAMSIGYQQLLHNSVYRNMDLITSTPALPLARRSMSPITKSTQRMPKAMQESIMTPRSRKPVMLLNGALANNDASQTTAQQKHVLSFSEQTEPEKQIEPPVLHSEDATSLGGYVDILRRRESSSKDALSSDFKEYLLTRSVLTASPVDLSFASRSDDFEGASTTQDYEDFDESELSSSLLYCLDGNEPAISSPNATDNAATFESESSSPLLTLGGNFNNARKRAALKTPKCNSDKENIQHVDEPMSTKKLLLTSHEKYPGETAL